jgi:uncharacterized protein
LLLPAVLTAIVALQAPLVWALGRLTGRLWLFAVIAAILTATFVTGLSRPRAIWAAPSRARLYLGMWPFFLWWTEALIFALLLPITVALRAALGLPAPAVLLATIVVAAVGVWLTLGQRPRLREREVWVAALPAVFDGYRIAQISDLHCGPFVSGQRVTGWVNAVNALRPDLIAVTGDLIASGSAFISIVADALGKLSARDGVFACMGNHDYFGDGEAMVRALERAGLTVLRNRGVEVGRNGAKLFVAGIDDTWTSRNDMSRALAGRPERTPTVLLAHDPSVFPDAVERSIDLTLSGHTHGGQIALPVFGRRVNLAKVMTRFTTDLYRSGSSTLYVNRGLGTTGPPVRLAVPPEIALITLRRAPSAEAAADVAA